VFRPRCAGGGAVPGAGNGTGVGAGRGAVAEGQGPGTNVCKVTVCLLI